MVAWFRVVVVVGVCMGSAAAVQGGASVRERGVVAQAVGAAGTPSVEVWGAAGLPRGRASSPLASAAYAGSAFTLSSISLDQDPEGDMPRQAAFLADGSAVLVANRDSDTVTFFDVAPFGTDVTLEVGQLPVDVAVAPVGDRAVVANVGNDTVTILDTAARSVVATVPISGGQPFAIEITADGATAVVAAVGTFGGSLSVVDIATASEVRTLQAPGLGAFGFEIVLATEVSANIFTPFAITPDGTTAITTDPLGGLVRFFDLTTGGATALVGTDDWPVSIDIASDGSFVVVGHEFGVDRVTVVDVATQTATASFPGPAGMSAREIRLTDDDARAVVASASGVGFVDLTSGAASVVPVVAASGDLELTFDGQFVVAAGSPTIVVDVATETLVATLPTPFFAEFATSPVEQRAVGLAFFADEDVRLLDTAGASATVTSAVPTGEPVEADAPRSVAVSPDGQLALVGNAMSRNASLVDLTSGDVVAYPECAGRPFDVAVSADGVHGVVCNQLGDTVTVIDIASGTSVAQLVVEDGPSSVVISPDGSTAWVATIGGTAGDDRLHRIDLAGALSAVTGSAVVGDLGSLTYSYDVASGIAVSPDGATVAVCATLDDEVRLIDAATLAEVARVPVGSAPIRVAFAPDGTRAYVVDALSNDVSVVAIAGSSSSVVTTVFAPNYPLLVVPDDVGEVFFIGAPSDGSVYVVDATTNQLVDFVSVPTGARAAAWEPGEGLLFVATTFGTLVRIADTSNGWAVVDQVALPGAPPDLALAEASNRLLVPRPGIDDALDVVAYGEIPFIDVGGALAGTFGPPVLFGAGSLLPGEQVALTLTNALPGAITTLVAGLSDASVPFKGGVLVPAPDALVGGLVVLGSGFVPLAGPWPPGIPSGTDLWLQHWILDPAGPTGFAASNALKLNVP